MSDMGRIWSKVSKHVETGCWIWMGSKKPNGYGQVWYNGGPVSAHRLLYELVKGPIPEGLQLDHLCRNRSCVNPDHLEPVSQRENVRRGKGLTALNMVKMTCPQGHPYSGENLYVNPTTGYRHCRACRQQHARKYRTTSNEVK